MHLLLERKKVIQELLGNGVKKKKLRKMAAIKEIPAARPSMLSSKFMALVIPITQI